MRTRKFLDAGWSSSKLQSHYPYYRGIQGETLQLIEDLGIHKQAAHLGLHGRESTTIGSSDCLVEGEQHFHAPYGDKRHLMSN